MASKEQLMKVALYCDEYKTDENSSIQSSVDPCINNMKSCENCTHFTANHKCDINLVDKILSSMAMELDNK